MLELCQGESSSFKTGVVAHPHAYSYFLLEIEKSSSDKTVLTVSTSREWIVDSSASKHMSPFKEGL